MAHTRHPVSNTIDTVFSRRGHHINEYIACSVSLESVKRFMELHDKNKDHDPYLAILNKHTAEKLTSMVEDRTNRPDHTEPLHLIRSRYVAWIKLKFGLDHAAATKLWDRFIGQLRVNPAT